MYGKLSAFALMAAFLSMMSLIMGLGFLLLAIIGIGVWLVTYKIQAEIRTLIYASVSGTMNYLATLSAGIILKSYISWQDDITMIVGMLCLSGGLSFAVAFLVNRIMEKKLEKENVEI